MRPRLWVAAARAPAWGGIGPDRRGGMDQETSLREKMVSSEISISGTSIGAASASATSASSTSAGETLTAEAPDKAADRRGQPEPLAADSCPACGDAGYTILFEAGDSLYHTTDRLFQILECARCRLIRLHPPPSPSELRTFYPEGYWEAHDATLTDRLEIWYRRVVLGDAVRFVERSLEESGEDGLALDVGCGGGLFLAMLAGRVRRPVAGLDFSLDAAAAASKRGVPAVCATLSRAPFAPGSCAAITMFQVVEHLYDPSSYLEAARELLAPHGRLIVQVPNAQSWQFLLFGERWSGLDVPRHLVHFRLCDLEKLLADCGFEILRVRHFSWRDNPAGLATSLAPSLDPTVRRLRGAVESPGLRLFKDAVYLALVAASVPFAMVEAACRAGSTVMIEARKKLD